MQRTSRLAATLVTLVILSGACTFARGAVPDAATPPLQSQPSTAGSAQSTPFRSPKLCISCHQKQVGEWNGSVHGLAQWDPAFKAALYPWLKGGGEESQCYGCHSPVGGKADCLDPLGASITDRGTNGVFCDVCHAVSALSRETPSFTGSGGAPVKLDPVIVSKEGPTFVKRGPFRPLDRCNGGYHLCAQSSLHKEADLCGSCHRSYPVDGRGSLEASYNQWEQGPYARKSILCQDCHMVEIPTFVRSADCFVKPERQEYRHYFNGSNYLLLYLAAETARKEGDDELARSLTEQYRMSLERLKAAAELTLTPLYHDGKLAELKVRVKNVRAGHNLPTALGPAREMWLEVTARDENGQILVARAAPRQEGALPGNVRYFRETIPPRGFQEVSYGFDFTTGVKTVDVEVKLRMRQAERALVAQLPPKFKERELATSGMATAPPLAVDMVVQRATLDAQTEGTR